MPIYDCALGRELTTEEEAAVTVPASLDERKAALLALADAASVEHIRQGYTPVTGPMAGETLQLRDLDDRTSWLAAQNAYAIAIAAGQGAVEGAVIRPLSNVNHTLTYADAHALLFDMFAWAQAVYVHCWSIKDAIAAAEDDAALDLIDMGAGWP